MGPSYQLINQVNDSKDYWKLRVRVSRLWNSLEFNNNDEIRSLDMLLLDENGDQINAIVSKKFIQKYKGALQEGQVYYIDNFNVILNRGNYRPVQHQYKIYFKWDTSIKMDSETTTIAMHKFYFVDFDIIPSRYQQDTYLTDVIGKLSGIGNVETLRKKNGSIVSKRDLLLQDIGGNSIQVTLWASHADNFPILAQDCSSSPIIIIVTSTFVKKFKDVYFLSSTTATKLYFNLEIPEVATVMDRIISLGPNEVQSLPSTQTQKVNLRELSIQNRVSIDDILQATKDPSNQGIKYTCKATICKIFSNFGWYYLSCDKCRKKVVSIEGKYFCNLCATEISCPTPRYMLRLNVKDHTNNTTFVLFDDEARMLTNRPVTELCDIYAKDDGPQIVSRLLEQLIGCMFVFQIRITEYNMTQKYPSYTCSKVFPIDFIEEAQQDLEIFNQEKQYPSAQMKISDVPKEKDLIHVPTSPSNKDLSQGDLDTLISIVSNDEDLGEPKSKKLCSLSSPEGNRIPSTQIKISIVPKEKELINVQTSTSNIDLTQGDLDTLISIVSNGEDLGEPKSKKICSKSSPEK